MEFKKFKEPQDSPKWLEWRESGVGGSEVSIIMGALPFKWNDVLELWKLKTKMKESDFVMNEAMQKGKDLEPEARERYMSVTKTKVKPTCFERTDFPFFRVSLDGITSDYKHIVEIKCPGLSKWKDAKMGRVAEYYYPQMQYQMLCSGATTCHYWVYRQEEGGVLINVPRNEDYIDELVRRCKIFWEGVENKNPVLPRHLGINMHGESDPYEAGDMTTELIGVYKN